MGENNNNIKKYTLQNFFNFFKKSIDLVFYIWYISIVKRKEGND